MKFVIGLMFDPTYSRIVLIRKARPEWQAGLLNAPGGKVEPTESEEYAVFREFKEETGVVIDGWVRFLDLEFVRDAHAPGDEGKMSCFYTTGNVDAAKTVTDEEIVIMTVSDVMDRCDTLPSLRWIIQMARSFPFGECSVKFTAQEIS